MPKIKSNRALNHEYAKALRAYIGQAFYLHRDNIITADEFVRYVASAAIQQPSDIHISLHHIQAKARRHNCSIIDPARLSI